MKYHSYICCCCVVACSTDNDGAARHRWLEYDGAQRNVIIVCRRLLVVVRSLVVVDRSKKGTHMHHCFGDCFFSTPPPQNPLAQYIHLTQREVLIERIFLEESMGGEFLVAMGQKCTRILG